MDEKLLILGLGKTGLSVLNFFYNKREVTIFDHRSIILEKESIESNYPKINWLLNTPLEQCIFDFDHIVVSPGFFKYRELFLEAKAKNIKVETDLDIFCSQVDSQKLIGVTGTNGKSTVVSLLAELLSASGYKALAIGNIGIPVLDAFLKNPDADFYVIECSSFQLELSNPLPLHIATILNLEDDHLDYHGNMRAYFLSKKKIHELTRYHILNEDMLYSDELKLALESFVSISTEKAESQYCLKKVDHTEYFVRKDELLIPVHKIFLKGKHNYFNVLVCIAFLDYLNISFDRYQEALKLFSGLPHRIQRVAEINQVTYVNDSKATNVSATIAAIDALATLGQKNIILIMGGDLKEGSLSSLEAKISSFVKALLVFGKDADVIKKTFEHLVETYQLSALDEIVKFGSSIASPNDIILLSPACSSLDMFKSFEERGELFSQSVNSLSLS